MVSIGYPGISTTLTDVTARTLLNGAQDAHPTAGLEQIPLR